MLGVHGSGFGQGGDLDAGVVEIDPLKAGDRDALKDAFQLLLIVGLAGGERRQNEGGLRPVHLHKMGAKLSSFRLHFDTLQAVILATEIVNQRLIVEPGAEMRAPVGQK